ncbi:hypothetical protein BDN70DRAFT_821770 [Pholiota conissans]|uniref:Uncharacterized protein n=1 Tax=Pholiota conissans TaxID=109636 RepID=A0A9P5YHM3_9AGAR|nr:hypothetical protein BDN70DRAFT_821770 [Pholiota conissans]
MSLSASTKLGDSLMKIPMLDVTGSNWVIYKECFVWSIDARGLLEHVDGSTLEPVNPISLRWAAAATVTTSAAVAKT